MAAARSRPRASARCSALPTGRVVIDLFETLMKGDIATALDTNRALYDAGADPGTILADLADFTHLVTRLKLVPGAAVATRR